VAALAGGLEMLLQDAGPALAGEHRRTTAALRDRARAMQEAINDLLDLSAIEAGQLRLQNEAFDLAEALNEVAAAVRPLADKKGLALQLQLAEDLGYARGDPRRVTQVLTKLLRHAIQGTERGSVSLRAARQGSTVVCMQVADTGRGMGADEVAQLFSPWRAADAAPGEGASHLKLAVSQRLAQLMGGDIGVTSQPEQGSTYTLTLPADNVVHA
jgi:signal transduction histidine kinase